MVLFKPSIQRIRHFLELFRDKIESAAFNDISGGDIANQAGNIFAVGYPNATGSGANSGFTKVYKYDGYGIN